MTRLALFLLLLAAPLWAQSVKLPAEVKGMPGEWIVVSPTSIDGGKPRWRLGPGLEEVNLAALFGDEIAAKAKGKVVKAATAGVYRLEAWNAKGDVASEIAVCDVLIGTPGPSPPTPPLPPGPNPPGPQPPGPQPPVVDPALKPTAATYVYEKDAGGIPSAVMAGMNKLNREKKIIAAVHEEDSTNGVGEIPAQFRAAVSAARAAGLPALVVTAGDKVLKVVKAPKTLEAVMEAVP